jgi:hypothetical protein
VVFDVVPAVVPGPVGSLELEQPTALNQQAASTVTTET